MATALASTILAGIASAIGLEKARPDAALIELGGQLEMAAAEVENACRRWEGHPDCEALLAPFFARYWELNRQILLIMPAATVAGVDVKIRALKLIYERGEENELGDLSETIDMRLPASIANEPLAVSA